MAFSVKHTFVSAKSDDVDATTVRPSNWNAEHTLLMATNRLLGRGTASTGAVEEIALGAGLTMTGTTLDTAATVGTGFPTPPQGRLTLQTVTPVMTTTQSAKTTIYYTPYVGNQVPIYNGTSMAMTTFAELSNITTATTVGSAGPAAVAANSNYDLFVWSNAGTMTLTRGPVWSSATARATSLVMVNGIWLNNATITNGPAASRGTYVGTVRSNASSTLNMIFNPAAAANGSVNVLGVYNAYNRVPTISVNRDSTASWTVPAAWRKFNNAANNSIGFVDGLAQSPIWACLQTPALSSVTTGEGSLLGLHLDWTSGAPDIQALAAAGYGVRISVGASVIGNFPPVLGYHVINALENANVGGTSFHGAEADLTGFATEHLQAMIWM